MTAKGRWTPLDALPFSVNPRDKQRYWREAGNQVSLMETSLGMEGGLNPEGRLKTPSREAHMQCGLLSLYRTRKNSQRSLPVLLYTMESVWSSHHGCFYWFLLHE